MPVRVNEATRQSRLVRSSWSYLWRTGSDLIRILVIYRPFRVFTIPALISFAGATLIALRFLFYLYHAGDGGHLQSLVLAGILYGFGGVLMAVAFLGDLLAINRRLLEELQLEARRRRTRDRAEGHPDA